MRIFPVLPVGVQQDPLIIPIDLAKSTNLIQFVLPTLKPEVTYVAELIVSALGSPSSFGGRNVSLDVNALKKLRAVTSDITLVNLNHTAGDTQKVNLASRQVSSRMQLDFNEKRIYKFFFKTSQNSRFFDKAQAMTFRYIEFVVQGKWKMIDHWQGNTPVYKDVITDANMVLSASELQSAQNETELKNLIANKMPKGENLPEAFNGNQMFIRGMKTLSFDGTECFDDYDIFGYTKTDVIGGKVSLPPLVDLSNAAVNSWVPTMLQNVKTKYNIDIGLDAGSTNFTNNDANAQKRIGTAQNTYILDHINVKKLPKLSPNEVLGVAAPYDCGVADYVTAQAKVMDASSNATDVGFVSWQAEALVRGTGRITGTMQLVYNLPKPYNIPVSSANQQMSSNSNQKTMFQSQKLSSAGKVYSASIDAISNFSVNQAQATIQYAPPGCQKNQKSNMAAKTVSFNFQK